MPSPPSAAGPGSASFDDGAVEERHDDDRRLHKNRVAGGGRAREAEQLRQLAEEQVEAELGRGTEGASPLVGVRRTHSAGRPLHRTQQQEHERADGVARQVREQCRRWVLYRQQ